MRAIASRVLDVMGAFTLMQEGLGLPADGAPVFRSFWRGIGGFRPAKGGG